MVMMKMYFHFRQQEPILFKEWLPQTLTAYILSCFGVAAIAIFYELVRFGRAKITEMPTSAQSCCEDSSLYSESEELSPSIKAELPFSPSLLRRGKHASSTLVYFAQMFVGYSLMMIAMTYNVPIVASMIVGHMVAFFLLGPFMTIEEGENIGDCCN